MRHQANPGAVIPARTHLPLRRRYIRHGTRRGGVGLRSASIRSYLGSTVPARDIPRYIAMWRNGRLPVEKLLTSISPLSDINGLLDSLADGKAIRQVMVP